MREPPDQCPTRLTMDRTSWEENKTGWAVQRAAPGSIMESLPLKVMKRKPANSSPYKSKEQRKQDREGSISHSSAKHRNASRRFAMNRTKQTYARSVLRSKRDSGSPLELRRYKEASQQPANALEENLPIPGTV
mmetsp:Transcript_33517/g.75246  ORF Transcript_33517/g.75246 Transcript_33517/m.75246 type:complete len:134 (-) Transcript_33517:541-942(-)